MKTLSMAAVLMCLISTLPCNAKFKGGDVGNGCVTVVDHFENGSFRSAEVLDYYEAAVLRKIFYSLGDPQIPALDKVSLVFKKLRRVDPERADRYQEKARRFFDNANLIPHVLLAKTNDWGYVTSALPPSAKIEQLIIQSPPKFPEDKLYTINQDLWDKLDNNHKAGAIIHEIVYEEAINKYGHKDSVNTRYFVSIISSDRLTAMSSEDYRELLNLVGFASQGTNHPPVWLEDPIQYVACVNKAFAADLASKVKDPDGDPVKFGLPGGKIPEWLQLTPSGVLSGLPSANDVGLIGLWVSVADPFVIGVNTISIDVRKCDSKPKWISSINLGVQKINHPFVADLNQYVENPSGYKLAFNADRLPYWMRVSADGHLLGVPTKDDPVGKYDGTISFMTADGEYGDKTEVFGEVVTQLTPSSSSLTLVLWGVPWCATCHKTIPQTQFKTKEMLGNDYSKVAFQLWVPTGNRPVDRPTLEVAEQFKEKLGIDAQVFIDPWHFTTYKQYFHDKTVTLPAAVLLDKDENVVALFPNLDPEIVAKTVKEHME